MSKIVAFTHLTRDGDHAGTRKSRRGHAGRLPGRRLFNEGTRRALRFIDDLALDHYYLFHAIRAGLLRRLDREAKAALDYEAAMARTENATERDCLQRRRQGLRRA